MEIKVKKLHSNARLPEFAKPGDAGADLYAIKSYTIYQGQPKLIQTGISIEIPEGYEGQIRSKSGIALKAGVFVINSPGTIDSGYRGEIGIILLNTDNQHFRITEGMKVAQLVINKIPEVSYVEAKELIETVRSDGGFGSTGAK